MSLDRYAKIAGLVKDIEITAIHKEKAEEFKAFVTSNKNLTANVSAMDTLRVVAELAAEGKYQQAGEIIAQVSRIDPFLGDALKEATFEYLKGGPEIYKYAEISYPNKYSEVDIARKTEENYQLENTLPDAEAKKLLISGLCETGVQIPENVLYKLIPDAKKVFHMDSMNQSFQIRSTNDGYELVGYNGRTMKIDPEKFDLNDLATATEKIMKSQIDMKLHNAYVVKRESVRDLYTFMYIARKYQGIARELELDMYKDNSNKRPPDNFAKNVLYTEEYLNQFNKNDKPKENEIPDLGGTIYEPGPKIPEKPEIDYIEKKDKYFSDATYNQPNEMPDFSNIKEMDFENPIEIPFIDDIEEIADPNEADREAIRKKALELDDGELYF